MNTRQLIERYFYAVRNEGDWQSMIADDMKFTSPAGSTVGKQEYLIAASRFFKMSTDLEIKKLIVDGQSAGVWVSYFLLLNGKRHECLVSEWLEVNDGRLVSSSILFDTLALKNFTS